MKVTIDEDLCTGCGLCETICPDVFELNDDGIAEVIGEVDEDLKDDVQEAIDSCPVECISWVEE